VVLRAGGTKEGGRGELLSLVFVLESMFRTGQGASCKLCARRKERKKNPVVQNSAEFNF